LGGDALFPILVRQRPEIVITLADVWWLPYFCAPHVRRQMELTDTPWALYFPIDGDMEGERLPASWLELLREVDLPIAMSQYGQRIAARNAVSADYIPHGVDLELFCPPADRDAAKKEVNAQGKFLILSDSRNQPRKMLPRLLDLFARFAAGRPDALLHLHTDPEDEFTRSGVYSYDIRADLRHLGIESQVRFTPGLEMKRGGGVALTELARYYRAADVHLLASSGEGFGLPTLQAAAAGAVPMAGDYTASRELVEGHGEAIRIAEWSENEFGIRRGLIDIDDAVSKLSHYYEHRSDLVERSFRARQFASAYGWSTVVGQWDDLLHKIARRNRRILRVVATKTLPLKKLPAGLAPSDGGFSVKINVSERQFGRVESALIADTRTRLSDVHIPAVQQPCEVARLRVLRSPSYIGVAPGDQSTFLALKGIFPILAGWVPASWPSQAAQPESLKVIFAEESRELRYELAQSVLLLNASGEFSDATLVDAALFGVPCVGSGASSVQRDLWPDLVVHNPLEAIEVARAVLTNPAWLRRESARASACREIYKPDEEEAAQWLRRLHASQTPVAVG
jgi:glycosyltransferase involved in cell wall biosynthesis